MQAGKYHIRTKVDRRFVGSFIVEDRTFNPKPVCALYEGSHESPEWNLVEKSSGFEMSTRGAHTAIIDGRVFAIFTPNPGATIFKLEAMFYFGQNTYTIVSAENPNMVWTVPTGDDDDGQLSQITIKELATEPSGVPDKQLFIVTKAN